MSKSSFLSLKNSSKQTRLLYTLVAILGVALAAAFLRGWAVVHLPLDHDERIYVFTARYYADALRSGNLKAIPKYTVNYEHPDFVKLVYAVALDLTQMQLPTFNKQGFVVGDRLADSLPAKPMVVMSRWVSMVFGVLAATLLAVMNPVAGLFLAIHTFAVKYTSVAYLESIPSFTTLITILTYLRWEKAQFYQPARLLFKKLPIAYVWLGLSAVALGLSAASKYIYGIVGIAVVLYALYQVLFSHQAFKLTLVGLLGWGFVAAAAFFVADPYLWLDPLHRLHGSLAFSTAYSTSTGVEAWNYPIWQPLVWLARPVTGHNPAAIPFLPGDFLITWDVPINLLALIGLPRLFRRNKLFAFWLTIAMGFLLIWNTKWPQYGMILLAPLCLSAAEGLATLLSFLGWLLRLLYVKPVEAAGGK